MRLTGKETVFAEYLHHAGVVCLHKLRKAYAHVGDAAHVFRKSGVVRACVVKFFRFHNLIIS